MCINHTITTTTPISKPFYFVGSQSSRLTLCVQSANECILFVYAEWPNYSMAHPNQYGFLATFLSNESKDLPFVSSFNWCWMKEHAPVRHMDWRQICLSVRANLLLCDSLPPRPLQLVLCLPNMNGANGEYSMNCNTNRIYDKSNSGRMESIRWLNGYPISWTLYWRDDQKQYALHRGTGRIYETITIIPIAFKILDTQLRRINKHFEMPNLHMYTISCHEQI